MVRFPNAKINIGLEIIRKRPDGFHDISTVMYPIPWTDILEIIPANNDEEYAIEVSGYSIGCPPEKNLVTKAIRETEKFVGKSLPCKAHLHKIVPDGAGLGGGSSDAAFAVDMLNKMFNLGLSRNDRLFIASRLGSDCPFFEYDMPMMATGRGEILTPVSVSLKDYHIVIIKPSFSISTPEAYANVIPRNSESRLDELIVMPVETWKENIVNDFESYALKRFPVLNEIKEQLYALGATYAAMSGSGSAMYGIFRPTTDNMTEIARLLQGKDNIVFTGCLKY